MKKILITLFSFTAILLANSYVGDKACLECHKKEHKEWRGSDHDLAMQIANATTVLGDFNNAHLNYNGIITTFFKKNGKFMVRTDGADGKLHDYEVSYTFGVYPLQQYMVKFPNGRVQVLDKAWDSRSKSQGGGRWFHLHEKENVKAGDVLHWSGVNFNWNYMCADCHSTNFQKNYNPKTKKYASTYAQINVSCEACHGEGSEHIRWAKNPKSYDGTLKKGLKFIGSRNHWHIDVSTKKPVLENAINRDEVMLCAKCHSRRTQFGDDFKNAKNYHDNYRLATLSERLYEPDGQIKDEVYVYGSFVQSKMYEAGVTCSDCHNSHSLKRRAVGDNVCNKCHLRVIYDNPKHTHHKKKSAGCIACHMPSKIYMGVDERNDHSFRIPRPDLSAELNTSNACRSCHKDKTDSFLTNAMKQWYKKIPIGHQKFAHQIDANRKNSENAYKDLYAVLMSDAPDIAKATLIPRLGMYPSKQTYMTSLQMLRSHNPTIRIAALQSLENFPPQYVMKDIFKMLDDGAKSVRIEAMRILLQFHTGKLSAKEQKIYDRVFQEYKASLLFLSDRAEGQVALARLYENTGALKNAETAYKEALRIQKFYIVTYVNYAHFLQLQGREQEALMILNKGIKLIGKEPLLLEPLALWYIRNKQKDKGVSILQSGAKMYPENARLQYLYGIAIADKNIDKAIVVLENALEYHSGDLAILNGLIYYYEQKNNKMMSNLYKQKVHNMMQLQ